MNTRIEAEYEIREWMGQEDVVLKTRTFNALVDLVLSAQNSARMEESGNAANWCDGLAMLYPRTDVGFDIGYSMAAARAAKDIRSQAWRNND